MTRHEPTASARVALVTGANRGLGVTVAALLAATRPRPGDRRPPRGGQAE